MPPLMPPLSTLANLATLVTLVTLVNRYVTHYVTHETLWMFFFWMFSTPVMNPVRSAGGCFLQCRRSPKHAAPSHCFPAEKMFSVVEGSSVERVEVWSVWRCGGVKVRRCGGADGVRFQCGE